MVPFPEDREESFPGVREEPFPGVREEPFPGVRVVSHSDHGELQSDEVQLINHRGGMEAETLEGPGGGPKSGGKMDGLQI